MSSTHLVLKTRFFFLSDSCGFIDVGHLLWREDRSVLYKVQCIYILHFITWMYIHNIYKASVSSGSNYNWTTSPHYISLARTTQKMFLPLLRVLSLTEGTLCPQSCSLATALVLSPVYTAVTCQWVCMSQYIQYTSGQQVRSCSICIGNAASFPWVLWLPLPIIPPAAPYSLIFRSSALYRLNTDGVIK
jgi:hypothetical protein